jgi:hypothetical protein
MMSVQEDDKVGYRKPPTRTRFQPGVSGNPEGRRKGSVNLKTDLRSELSERIHIREGERSLKISKQRAMLKAMVAKALKGDARAATVVLTLVGRLFEPEVSEEIPALTSDDQAILERFLARRIADHKREA